ncbi:MAG: pantoate kinase [Candidatus Heimdallarchaeaceae archaeon]
MIHYWVASHISGIFTIHDEQKNTLEKGSRGAGFSISRGTTTSVEFSEDGKHHVFFNNKEVDEKKGNITFYVLKYVLNLEKNRNKIDFGINIFHEFEVPLSSGYGASASGALGCALALNELLDLGLEEKEIYQIAHTAEIVEGGGLGDILALYQGGWEYRLKEGAPFVGQAKNILHNGYKVATIHFGQLSTKSIIKNPNWKEKINNVGIVLMNDLIKEPTIRNFAIISKQFSISSFLATPEIVDFMNKYDSENLLISQIMLGNGVFILYQNQKDLPSHENLVLEEICHSTIKKIQ